MFDEASQMRVENAVPALYRAKRAVVSGDSKQLPPSSFFSTRIESEENEPDDDWLDPAELEDAEAEAAESHCRRSAANRRHVKDCGDMLALAEGVLPTASLDIHYRSEYRELIAFLAVRWGGFLPLMMAVMISGPAREDAEGETLCTDVR